MTNPEWKPPEAGHAYINDMKELGEWSSAHAQSV